MNELFYKRVKGYQESDVGWKNDDDSISIVIAPGVVLQRKTNLVITLFPILLNNMKGII